MNKKPLFFFVLIVVVGIIGVVHAADDRSQEKIFQEAVEKGEAGVSVVEKLLDGGFNVNGEVRGRLVRHTLLDEAVCTENYPLVDLLIKRNANIGSSSLLISVEKR